MNYEQVILLYRLKDQIKEVCFLYDKQKERIATLEERVQTLERMVISDGK